MGYFWKHCSKNATIFNIWKCVFTLALLFLVIDTVRSQNKNSECPQNSQEVLPVIMPVLSSADTVEETPSELISDILNTSTHVESVWSQLTFENCQVRVSFWCNATYPIEWVEFYSKDIDLLTDTNNSIHKDLWTDRIINDTLLGNFNSSGSDDYPQLTSIDNPAVTSYTAVLGIKSSLCAAANYTCRSVSNHCLQASVVSVADPINKTILYQYSNMSIADIPNESTNKPCEASIIVTTKYGVPGWACTSSRTRYDIFWRNCDGAMHCNNHLVYHKQKCVIRLQKDEECVECRYTNNAKHKYSSGIVWCQDKYVADQTIHTALQFFFSVPQTTNSTDTELYLDWGEADPQKMLFLEPLPDEEVFLGQNISLFCSVSRSYFSYGHRFGLEYENGTIFYTPHIDGEYRDFFNVNLMNITISVTDPNLARIYCFAPVWNSTKWINQSIDLNISRDAAAFPSIRLEVDNIRLEISDSDSQNGHEVTLKTHQRNATLTCEAQGRPIPEVEWIAKNNANVIQTQVEPGKKVLTFSYVTHDTKGMYKCVAKNFVGMAEALVQVDVRDDSAFILKLMVALFATVVVSLLITLVLCWKKVQTQKRQLQALTDAEIKEFREGNLEILHASEYLDTEVLLHALPYNDEYEIPGESLYIDNSSVLGSGNFGQVLKGKCVIRENSGSQKYIDVAVKTMKPNQPNALYFKTLLSEVKIMAYLGQHINVVSLVGACTANIRKGKIFIAVEFCHKGSLETCLKNCRSTYLDLISNDTIYINTSLSTDDPLQHHTYENVAQALPELNLDENGCTSTIHLLKWSREIANGMEFLGSRKIIHGDLATRNVLLSQNLVAKIGDFGLSRQLIEYSNYIRSTDDDCVLPWKWMAVETLQDMKFSVKSDVWSYGVTLWEIFSLAQLPYPGRNWNANFLEDLKAGDRLGKPPFATSQIYNIMLECWALEPPYRPHFTDLKDSFEGLLLQTCADDYVDTRSSLTQETYVNGFANPRASNPGYMRLGMKNVFDGITRDAGEASSGSSNTISHTNYTSIVASSTTEEANAGYLTPLLPETLELEELYHKH